MFNMIPFYKEIRIRICIENIPGRQIPTVIPYVKGGKCNCNFLLCAFLQFPNFLQ